MKKKLAISRWPRLVAAMAMTAWLLPCVALAGGEASLMIGGEPLRVAGQSMAGGSSAATVTWRDAETVRMDLGDQSSYLIMRDGKVYSVSQSGGEAQVMDMAVMTKMLQSMGRPGAKNKSKNPFGSVDSIEATGATETVAGIQGRVYHMAWTDGDGGKQSGDAVLTDDPLVVEMTHAYIAMMGGMVGEETTHAFQEALPGKDHGLLRVGDQFRITEIRRADPPESTFTLPAKPMDMQNLMGGMGGR